MGRRGDCLIVGVGAWHAPQEQRAERFVEALRVALVGLGQDRVVAQQQKRSECCPLGRTYG
jgi:hypothetical protein